MYRIGLEKTKSTKNTEDKIDLVKDLLPDSLKPEGFNPLATLHSVLSEGLHGKTDEECLTKSMAIRNILEFLTRQISQTKEANKAFTDHMKKLLDMKSTNI